MRRSVVADRGEEEDVEGELGDDELFDGSEEVFPNRSRANDILTFFNFSYLVTNSISLFRLHCLSFSLSAPCSSLS